MHAHVHVHVFARARARMYTCYDRRVHMQERGVAYAASPFGFTLPTLSSVDSTRCEYR